MTAPRLNLLGAGRVGKTLARLWHLNGPLQIQNVLTTTPASAQSAVEYIGAGHAVPNLAAMCPAELWMIATPDTQIAAIADQLAAVQAQRSHNTAAAPIVFHASGALGSDQLAPLQALGWLTASAHCLLSFATPDAAVAQFKGTACALEGEPQACAVLRQYFTSIGTRCFDLASADKLLYHAAAVFATNFLPVLQSVAEDLWQRTGVPEEMIPALRATLLNNAVANITQLGPQAALTGPAARGDTAAIARQGAAVSAWSADAGAAYAALSALALQLAHQRNKPKPSA